MYRPNVERRIVRWGEVLLTNLEDVLGDDL